MLHPADAALAPRFRLPDERGNAHTPESLAGRVVWIDLWADWCGTCRAEFPGVQSIHERNERLGLTVLAVGRNSKRAGFVAAVEKEWRTFPVVDASGQSDFPFPYAAFPTSVILDRAGRVRAYWTGHRPLDGVEGVLRHLLAERPEASVSTSPAPPAGAERPRLSAPPPPSSGSVVTASLVLPRAAVAPGGLARGIVVFEIDPGWHLLAAADGAAVPFELRVESPPAAPFEHLAPHPRERELAGHPVSVYSGKVEIPIWGVIPVGAPLGHSLELTVTATLQACDAASCLLPVLVRLDGEVWVDEPAEDP